MWCCEWLHRELPGGASGWRGQLATRDGIWGEGGQCATVAFSAPAPVRDRTSISAYFRASALFGSVMLPSQPSRKASGIETSPGLSSGNQEKSTLQHRRALAGRFHDRLARHHRREDDQRDRGDQTAVDAPQGAAGGEPLPEQRVEDRRQVRRCRHREGRATRNAMFWSLARIPPTIANQADRGLPPSGNPAPPASARNLSALDVVGVDVVGEGCACGNRQTRHHREDRRERDRRDEPEQQGFRRVRRPAAVLRSCAPGRAIDDVGADQAAAPKPSTRLNR